MHYLDEKYIYVFLIQVLIILGASRFLGEIFRRWKQPALTAEIIIGILLGPTILGRFLPALQQSLFPIDTTQLNMLETISWLGVLFLLMETGLEIDFSSAWRQRGDALTIALTDIILPMAICFLPAFLLPDSYLVNTDRRIIFAFFIAIVLTISAMPITARALHDLRLLKTDLGFLIMSALSVNDIIGWLIFAIVLGIFMQAQVSVMGNFAVFIFTISFTLLCLSLGRVITGRAIAAIKRHKMPEPATSLTFICLLGFLCGAITQKIGIHALFGFFIAGIMAGASPALPEKTRQIFSQMVYALFVPFFFVNIGLKVDFLGNFDLLLVVLFSLFGIVGRFLGAWVGVRLTRIDSVNRLAVAIAHIPGGVMEIVLSLLALESGLITKPVFVAIVFSAVLSSVILGPWLSYALSKRQKISVLEFFSPRAIIPSVHSTNRNEAIWKLCECASEQENILDPENLYSLVLQREMSMGTALEEGIAVPHTRLPEIKKPFIVFGRSLSGIDWDSPDGTATQFIFLILTPEKNDLQVQVLASIAKACSDKEVRSALLGAANTQEIWDIFHQSFSEANVINHEKRKG
jgi:Kef-type K+ transport system membrane component KefB/mannitol/fructose-specific phosphotransferase system IIA component (Ntr-type)